MTDLLKPERVAVATEGTLVAFSIGNSTLKMGYEDALKIAAMIRMHAKQAKANAGDTSRHWSVCANLTAIDAGANPFARREF